MDASSLYSQAEQALAKGDLHTAAALAKEILEHFPQSAQGYHLMSSLFQATGNYQKARDYSQHATALDGLVAQYHLQQGQTLFALQEYESAATSFMRAAELALSDGEAPRMVAHCYMQLEHFTEAKQWLARARERSSPEATIMDEAQCLIQTGDEEAAEALVTDFLASTPTHAGAHLLLAELALHNQETARAEQYLRKSLALDANQPEVHFYLALLTAESGNDRGASERLLQALQLAPTHIPSLLLLGGLFMKLGDAAASEKAFVHVITLAPQHVIAWHSLLELFKMYGKKKEGLARLEATIAHTGSPALKHLRELYIGETPACAPPYFVRSFYDLLINSFEPWMIGGSDTRHLDLLIDEIRALPQMETKRYASVLDLGCGVGSLTRKMGEFAALKVGVDVSPRLLKIARRKKIFDAVYEMNLLEYMQGSEMTFDIVAAGGALRWVGNLQPFFLLARTVLRDEGVLAFILDKESSNLAYSVRSDGRYSHNLAYVLDTARAEGLQLITHKELTWIAAEEGMVFRHLFIFKKMTLH